jgi:hypothetical protein
VGFVLKSLGRKGIGGLSRMAWEVTRHVVGRVSTSCERGGSFSCAHMEVGGGGGNQKPALREGLAARRTGVRAPFTPALHQEAGRCWKTSNDEEVRLYYGFIS